MPAFCSVVGCSKRSERDKVSFFRIPAAFKDRGIKLNALSRERRESWVKALKRGELSETFLKNARICSNHFVTGRPAAIEDKDHPDWIPSQNMGYISVKNRIDSTAVKRHSRVVRRAERNIMDDSDEIMEFSNFDEIGLPIRYDAKAGSSSNVEPLSEEEPATGVEVQTDMTMEDIVKLLNEINFSTEKIQSLQEKINKIDLSEDSFKGNDLKTLYFTGFPKTEIMFNIFTDVKDFLTTKSVLSPFKQFILTLLKLRLNLPFKYLSYRFGVAPSTASETFYRCLDILYARYKNLVFWPSREILQKNVPDCFKENFGNRVTVIIDCFEIFCETPSNMLNAAQCWSNYKHHETVKFLIGITPQGTISFISEAWAGRTSDKFLTENCGFLDNILPGDVILADRGFLIKDSVKTLGGHLEIPAFTKGKSQLEPLDLETTRKIANVRIHVERIIGLLRKKYRICKGPLPMSMVSASKDDLCVLDKIIVVCSAFINLWPSQIPMK